jgi:hypothetical protein
MKTRACITVSLPDDVLDAIDEIKVREERMRSQIVDRSLGAGLRAVQRSLLWWHGPGESEMPHTDANRPVIANWWFPRRGAI